MTEKERQQYRKLQASAKDYFAKARNHLRRIARSGQSRGYFPGGGFSFDGGRGSIPYGAEPSESDVQAFIESTGGNPFLARMRGMADRAQAVASTSRATGRAFNRQMESANEQADLVRQLFDDINTQRDRANAANQARYDEVHGMYSDLGARNQERIGNWGYAQEALNEERAAETLGDVSANLAMRGLANSTNLDAFRQRNARDLALTQQALSEARDERMLRSDSLDTERLGQFVERRTDVAPDPSPYLQLALQYGRSGDGQGFQQERLAAPAYTPARQAPVLPMGGGPVFMGGDPFAVARGFLGGGGGFSQQPQYAPAPIYGDDGGDRFANTRARMAREQAALAERIRRRKGGAPTNHLLTAPPTGIPFPIYA